MTDNQPESLEQTLQAMKWWPEAAPKLWERALSMSHRSHRRGSVHRLLHTRWFWFGSAAAAFVAAAVVIHPAIDARRMRSRANLQSIYSGLYSYTADQSAKSFISPSFEDAAPQDNRQVRWNFDKEPNSFGGWNEECGLSLGGASRGDFRINPDGSRAPVRNWLSPSAGASASSPPDSDGDGSPAATPSIAWGVVGSDAAATFSYRLAQLPQSQPSDTARDIAREPAALSRHIIHRASIDLKTDDVRGVYIKLQTLIPSPGEGEYVEAAQIHTNNNLVTGYVTLRIQPTRLAQVLSALRNLAEVTSEQTDASDVTTQVVDLEARLRNEKRVEQELLDLLEKRQDAPLEDILKVNDSLAQVRGRIEQMTAQQQTLARQVALAAVVVTIRQKDAPPPEPVSASFGARLAAKIKSAWTAGLDFLASSVAAILQTIVGGLLFWIGLIVVVILLRRWYFRRST